MKIIVNRGLIIFFLLISSVFLNFSTHQKSKIKLELVKAEYSLKSTKKINTQFRIEIWINISNNNLKEILIFEFFLNEQFSSIENETILIKGNGWRAFFYRSFYSSTEQIIKVEATFMDEDGTIFKKDLPNSVYKRPVGMKNDVKR